MKKGLKKELKELKELLKKELKEQERRLLKEIARKIKNSNSIVFLCDLKNLCPESLLGWEIRVNVTLETDIILAIKF